jgi:uncharacterized membrane protein
MTEHDHSGVRTLFARRSGTRLSLQVTNRLTQLPVAFVVFASVIGTFLVFAQPPGQGLDEADHFYRVWALSGGTLIAPVHHGAAGGSIPQCVVSYISRFAAEASKRSSFSVGQYWQSPVACSQQTGFTDMGTIPAYGPISYLPAIVAVAFLHGIGAPLPVIFFGGRLASLAGFIALFALAIRVAPTGRQVLFVLGLLPTTLLLAASYSADPMTISLAALAVALTLRCFHSDKADWRMAALLFFVLLCLCLTKPNLFPFALLLFLVPTAKIRTLRYPNLVRTAGVAICLVAAGLWYLAVRNVVGVPVPLYGLDSHSQIHFITHQPVRYLEVLGRTLFGGKGQGFWLAGMFFAIGYSRPFNDTIVAPVGIVVVGSLTLWYAFQLQLGARRKIIGNTWLLAWIPIVVLVAEVLIIETTLFVYGTPVGYSTTLAQGRYFLPLLTLPLLTMGLLREPSVRPRSTRWVLLGSAVMLLWLVLKIFVHDYNF